MQQYIVQYNIMVMLHDRKRKNNMYKLKVNDETLLEKLNFKQYKDGYSKKVVGKNYDFLDIKFENRIVNKAKFDKNTNEFIFEPASESEIANAIILEIFKKVKE